MTTTTVTPATLKPITFGQVKQFIKTTIRETNPGCVTTVSTGKFATDSGIISYEANVGHLDDKDSFGEGILELKVSEGEHNTSLDFTTQDDWIGVEFNYHKKGSVYLNNSQAPDELPDNLKSWIQLGKHSVKLGDKQRYLRSLSILSKLIHNC